MMKSLPLTKAALLLAFCFSMNLYAQDDYILTYDASGNRTGFALNVVELKASDTVSGIPDGYPVTDSIGGATVQDGATAITVYPNPTFGLLTVEVNTAETLTGGGIVVYNNSGMRVAQKHSLDAINSIDLTGQPAGVYFMKVYTEGKPVSKWKIVKH